MSGFWLGVTYPNDPQLEIYNYTTTLIQNGPGINGVAQTANPNVPFGGGVLVKGQFVSGQLTFKESDSQGNRNTPNLCYWDIKLTYDPATESLKGSYSNILNPPYCDKPGDGKLELYRIRLKSGNTYCKNAPAQLDVTGVNIRWYDGPSKNRLLAKGSHYTATLPQSTTLYVTQTIYNTESPPVPIFVNVMEDCQQESVYLPSAFTPNGDAQNEALTIHFPFPSAIVRQFTVFNRWGEVVYSRDGFSVKSGESLWDGGTANEATGQTFTYILDLQTPLNGLFATRRTVTVLR